MIKHQFEEFEEAFSRMKKAAGVSDVEEVVTRFSTQNKTAEILEDQMTKAETDVRTLGELKESLQKEWELVRYLGQDEDIKIREKFEELELDMEEVNERMDKTGGKLQVLEGNHDMIKRKLSRMASVIEGSSYVFILIFKCCRGPSRLIGAVIAQINLEHFFS